MSVQSTFTKSQFQTDKSKTDKFFKDTKVDSCSRVLVRNGHTVAVPFSIVNAKGKTLLNYKSDSGKPSESKSIYKQDYKVKPYMHAGMERKPLVPYHPESYRSRLPVGGVVMSHKNKSVVEIGDRGLVNRKQWKSTTRDTFTAPKVLPISNPGITSEITKRTHQKLQSII